MRVEPPQSDADLLKAVAAGDAWAYEELRERHAAAARALARRLVRGETEAEDVVAESFTRVLDLVGRGAEPGAAFRVHLLAVVRRTVHDRARIAGGSSPEPFGPFVDAALVGLRGAMLARAFLSLPERWQAVLWHVEVERSRPADVAPLLGLPPDGVRALTGRARAELRRAYLRTHLSAPHPEPCGPYLGLLADHVVNDLPRRAVREVEGHVEGCPECRAVMTELYDLERDPRGVLGPLLVGPVFPTYSATLPRTRLTRAETVRSVPILRDQPAVTTGVPQRSAALTGGDAALGDRPAHPTITHAARPTPSAAPHEDQPAHAVPPRSGRPAEDAARQPEQPAQEGAQAPVTPVEGGEGVAGGEGVPVEGGEVVPGEGGEGVPGEGGEVAPVEGGEVVPSEGGGVVPGERGGGVQGVPSGAGSGVVVGRRSRGRFRRVVADRRVRAAGCAAVAVTSAAAFALIAGSGTRPDGRPASSSVVHPLVSVQPPPTLLPTLPPTPPPAAPTPEAIPEHAAAPAGRPRLQASIDPAGSLVPSRPGIVAVRLRNIGDGPSRALEALVHLPPGVTLSPSGPHIHGPGAGPSARRGTAPSVEESTDESTDPSAGRPTRPNTGPATGPAPGPATGSATGRSADRAGGPSAGLRTGGRHRARFVGPAGTGDGWTCRAVWQGARCAREPLEAGGRTAVFLRVQVAPDAPTGHGPSVRLKAGPLQVTARAAAGVRPGGAPARFAADGRVTAMAVGNSLLSCPAERAGCAEARQRAGDRRDNDLWPLVPLDEDAVPATTASSGAELRLPRGSRVVWAGLYWSAASRTPGRPIKFRTPGQRRYVVVRPDEVMARELPAGAGYQAFADVTGLVGNARKEGAWWAADPPMEPGASRHAGWSLVVVATGPALPYGRAVVLDTATVTGGAEGDLRLPLGGLTPAWTSPPEPTRGSSTHAPTRHFEPLARPAGASAGETGSPVRRAEVRGVRAAGGSAESGRGRGGGAGGGRVPARVELVVWEGDAGLDGDGVSAGEGPLAPVGGDRDPADVFDGSANGAQGTTFGVDVDTFHTALGEEPVLTIAAERDVLLFGVVAVSVRARP